jgi:hypothetical protein
LQFTGLARGRFTLSGLTIDGALTVDAHAGLVVLHDLAVKGVYLFGCPNVLVQDVVVRDLPGFAQAAFAADDSVSINRCSLTGGPGHSTPHGGVPGGAGIEMHGGYTVVDHSLVAGGSYDGVGARFAAPTVLAATTTSFAGGLPFWRPQIAVQTDMFVQPGLVVHDRCTFTGALDYVVAVARSMPSLGGPANVARGATASYTIGGAGARTALLSFALDAAPQMHPQIGTPFWLFGPSVTAPLVLTTDALGQATVSVPIPNVAALQDLFLFAQGLGWVTDAQWRTTSVVVTRIR